MYYLGVCLELENDTLTMDVMLDELCRGCLYHEGTCPDCNGKGYVLTNAGEAIIELVKRHLLDNEGDEVKDE